MPRPVACYREIAPCEELREHVRAFFSFVPCAVKPPAHRRIIREVIFGEGESFCSPLFADGNVSMVISFGTACSLDAGWQTIPARPRGNVIGAVSAVDPASGDRRLEMIGIYFRPARACPFLHVPAVELTDRILPLDGLWGAAGSQLPFELSEANEATRLDRLESVLVARLRAAQPPATALDVPGLAALAIRRNGGLTVQCLADAAGVSRQHLTRVFREQIGVTPKLYCRLARFQAGLVYSGCGKSVDWARVALELGYTDQSHMIAEFRQFSSLTPVRLATNKWFHPFIERAKARQASAPELSRSV